MLHDIKLYISNIRQAILFSSLIPATYRYDKPLGNHNLLWAACENTLGFLIKDEIKLYCSWAVSVPPPFQGSH